MKCPKCGYDNPKDVLFCEECDWRLDIPYKPEKKRNPMAFSAVALVFGVVGALCGFLGQYVVAIVCGAIGLLLGGYSINLPRLLGSDNASACVAMSAIGLLCGVIGFVLGFGGALGAFRWQSTAASTYSRACPR